MTTEHTFALTKSQAEKAAYFLHLIRCAVATRDTHDDCDAVKMDNAEIDGFNVLAKALGEPTINMRIKYKARGEA